jgi:hypothetical protein
MPLKLPFSKTLTIEILFFGEIWCFCVRQLADGGKLNFSVLTHQFTFYNKTNKNNKNNKRDSKDFR